MSDQINYFEVEEPQLKSDYTRRILEALPDWFGDKEALDEYVEKVAELPYWAAFDEVNRCIGFFSAKIHYGHTGEIFVCGVHPDYHRRGIGEALYGKLEAYVQNHGCNVVIVQTLSDIDVNEHYERSRRFYKKLGFEPLITFTEMWTEQNHCLLMLKIL